MKAIEILFNCHKKIFGKHGNWCVPEKSLLVHPSLIRVLKFGKKNFLHFDFFLRAVWRMSVDMVLTIPTSIFNRIFGKIFTKKCLNRTSICHSPQKKVPPDFLYFKHLCHYYQPNQLKFDHLTPPNIWNFKWYCHHFQRNKWEIKCLLTKKIQNWSNICNCCLIFGILDFNQMNWR